MHRAPLRAPALAQVPAKRRTLELYELSYASGRRADEAAQSQLQVRALQREKMVARTIVLTAAAGSVAVAAYGALATVRPDWLDAISGFARGALSRRLVHGVLGKLHTLFDGVRALLSRHGGERLLQLTTSSKAATV